MNIESIREYCISKKGVNESFPFDETTLVFKVANKMFALLGLNSDFINLKCDPEIAISRREEFEEIKPGFHMNKKLWNSVVYTGNLKTTFIKEMIDESYNLILNSLTKKERDKII
jgi:predicted DNA-binding protein (MmcQ/YjbR family)